MSQEEAGNPSKSIFGWSGSGDEKIAGRKSFPKGEKIAGRKSVFRARGNKITARKRGDKFVRIFCGKEQDETDFSLSIRFRSFFKRFYISYTSVYRINYSFSQI